MQDKELNEKYRNNKLTINSNRCVRSVQLIIFIFDYKRLKRNKRLRKYIKMFVKLKL